MEQLYTFFFHLITVVVNWLRFCVLQHNARGMLSMANSGPNTNGSQFFISYAKQPHLNGLYTVFGRVIHGFEVLDLMEKVSSSSPNVNFYFF
jgi:cyclophilin family peptidyl-prolyl cis-trans isomerase